MSEVVGLRELRQHASAIVRRAEGHTIIVTVNGREAARLVPAAPRRWRMWSDVADLLTGPGDQELAGELAAWDDTPVDPLER